MFVGAEWMFKFPDRHFIAFPACDSSTHIALLRMYILWSLSVHLRDIHVSGGQGRHWRANEPGDQTLLHRRDTGIYTNISPTVTIISFMATHHYDWDDCHDSEDTHGAALHVRRQGNSSLFWRHHRNDQMIVFLWSYFTISDNLCYLESRVHTV